MPVHGVPLSVWSEGSPAKYWWQSSFITTSTWCPNLCENTFGEGLIFPAQLNFFIKDGYVLKLGSLLMKTVSGTFLCWSWVNLDTNHLFRMMKLYKDGLSCLFFLQYEINNNVIRSVFGSHQTTSDFIRWSHKHVAHRHKYYQLKSWTTLNLKDCQVANTATSKTRIQLSTAAKINV